MHYTGINLGYHFSPSAVKESLYIYSLSFFLPQLLGARYISQALPVNNMLLRYHWLQHCPRANKTGAAHTTQMSVSCQSNDIKSCSKCLFIIPHKEITFTFSLSRWKDLIKNSALKSGLAPK